VRLCEVTPDAASRLVTTDALNLTHREGHEVPEPLTPGRPYRVTVPLFATGHAFDLGSRIRLTVSASFWPWLWPSPTPTAVTIHSEGGTLHLPVRTPDPAQNGTPTVPPSRGTRSRPLSRSR
jgi:uncharacterized protein